MRRHRIALGTGLAALIVLATTSLAGCGSASKPVNAAAPGFGDNATGTVVFWARSDTITAATPLVKEFNATHPHLQVVMDSIQDTQAVTELATAIRGHAAPDLVDLNDIYMPIFTQLDAFANLTGAIRALPYAKDLSPRLHRAAEHLGGGFQRHPRPRRPSDGGGSGQPGGDFPADALPHDLER